MKLSIIVPAHNESDNLKLLIPQLVTALSRFGKEYEIIIVDNASTDDTQKTLKILSEKFPLIRTVFEKEKGFGGAVLRGLRESRGEVLGYIHADNQMKPEDILRIYQKLVQNDLGVCKATRVDRHDGVARWVISKTYNFLFRLIFRVRINDINGSPKLFTRNFFEKAKIESRDWFIDPEVIIKAKKLGVKIGEFEIHTLPRQHGASQVRPAAILEFLKHMLYYWRQK